MRYLSTSFLGLYVFECRSQVSSYLRILKHALSAFEGVTEKAHEIETKELEKLQSIPMSELIDGGLADEPDDLLRMAADAANDYLIHECSLMQGILNLFAVGLHHLLEQQMAFILKLGSVPLQLEADIGKFKNTAKEHCIDVESFASWREIEELRDVGNCAKHGEGRACDRLRNIRPELLGEAARIDHRSIGLHRLGVTQPLFGEHLCVTEKDLLRYGDSIKKFWQEFRAAVAQANNNVNES
jgi:hypothetical protein